MRTRKFLAWQGAMACAVVALLAGLALPAAAELPSGLRQIKLHARDGSATTIGQIRFTPQAGGRTGFEIQLQTERLADYFLSMREFKCLKGEGEVLCAVPYPYAHPGQIGEGDYAWLEHALLFLRNRPADHGARLSDGVYFALTPVGGGFEGRLQAVDLQQISAPPSDARPPYRAALRDDVNVSQRWFQRLTID